MPGLQASLHVTGHVRDGTRHRVLIEFPGELPGVAGSVHEDRRRPGAAAGHCRELRPVEEETVVDGVADDRHHPQGDRLPGRVVEGVGVTDLVALLTGDDGLAPGL